MPFVDSDVTTGSISGSGMHLPGHRHRRRFAARAEVAGETPDEDRIMRADKKGRIVQMLAGAPPKNFNAGSIFQRTSLSACGRAWTAV